MARTPVTGARLTGFGRMTVLFACLSCSFLWHFAAVSGDRFAAQPKTVESDARAHLVSEPGTVATAAMGAYVDTDSGQLAPAPGGAPALLPTPSLQRRLAEVSAPGGGTMVYLGDSFHSAVFSSVDSDGKAVIGCETVAGETQQ